MSSKKWRERRGRPKKSIFGDGATELPEYLTSMDPELHNQLFDVNRTIEESAESALKQLRESYGLTSRTISYEDICDIIGLEHEEHDSGVPLPTSEVERLNEKLDEITEKVRANCVKAGKKSPHESKLEIVLRHIPDLLDRMIDKPKYKSVIREIEGNPELFDELGGKVPSERTLRSWLKEYKTGN